jgi:hypothetical protein
MTEDYDARRDSADCYSLGIRIKRRELLDQQGRDYHVTVDAPFGTGRCRFQTMMKGVKRADAIAYADKDWPDVTVFIKDMNTHEAWHRLPGEEWREGEGEDV